MLHVRRKAAGHEHANVEPLGGPGWLHEIKHDGFRIMARRNAAGVRLYTRNGHDFSKRFAQIVAAVTALPVPSCFNTRRES